MTEHHIDVPGGRLYALDEGDPTAPPILLLHAGIADLRAWDDMAPLLTAAGYRVVRFDARGFGRSTTEAVEFTTHGDVLAVLDALSIERAAFVGNSRGGTMSFDTALEAPTGSSPSSASPPGSVASTARGHPRSRPSSPRWTASRRSSPGCGRRRRDRPAHLGRRPGPADDARRRPPSERSCATWISRRTGHPARSLDRPPGSAGRTRVAELRCPILLVIGGLDESGPAQVAAHLETAAVNAADVSVVTVPDVAHMIGMEVPDTLAALVVDFLAPLPRWS